jgi:hypothetical protein
LDGADRLEGLIGSIEENNIELRYYAADVEQELEDL